MKSSQRIRSRLHQDQRGAAAVEFAIVASLFFMLVFGIIDFGFAFHSWNNAVNAAREGARNAAVDSNVERHHASAFAPPRRRSTRRSSRSRCVCSHIGGAFATSSCGSTLVEGDIVRVIVDYGYDLITPLGSFVPGLGPTLNLHSQSESRFEGQ